MNLLNTSREFMLLEAASGYEKKMAYALNEKLRAYSDDVCIDKAGNVIAKFDGTNSIAPVIMVFAHMDQLGFIIRKIEEDGLIQIDRLGGIPEKVLPALNVSISNIEGEYIPGVIGVKSHHVTPPEEKYKVDTITNLFVDVGASNKAQVIEAGIHVGCPAIYKPSYTKLMGNRICGTAVDNRCGCAALVAIAEKLSQNKHESTVYIVGTVWEEFNLRGAIIASRKVHPDISICLDVTMTGDMPELKSKFDIGLGRGPAVGLYNFHSRGTLNGTIAHPGLYRLALETAMLKNIPLQEFSTIGMLTDAAYVQLEEAYVASIDMGFPARYTHTPIESADLDDVFNLANLVSAMVCRITPDFNLSRF